MLPAQFEDSHVRGRTQCFQCAVQLALVLHFLKHEPSRIGEVPLESVFSTAREADRQRRQSCTLVPCSRRQKSGRIER